MYSILTTQSFWPPRDVCSNNISDASMFTASQELQCVRLHFNFTCSPDWVRSPPFCLNIYKTTHFIRFRHCRNAVFELS